MSNEKEKTQRRVYVLPNDLVDRIVAYQTEMGIQSEVEAARRLLDEALKRRDDWRSITRRFLDRLNHTRVLTDIAGEVLMGHPLVEQMSFSQDSIMFKLFTGEFVTVNKDGTMHASRSSGYGNDEVLQLDPKPAKKSSTSFKSDDDDIPF